MANQREPRASQEGEQNQGAASEPAGGSGQSMERRATGSAAPARGGPYTTPGPFSLMRRISEDMDRFFHDFFGPSPFRWPGAEGFGRSIGEDTSWPQVEVHHEGGKLVVQADVPGLKREDMNVEVRDEELCISGVRRSETERNERGYYRSERTYGSFVRTIPLPEGTKPDTASASFENGVLRIEMDAPTGSATGQSRRIEVREGSPH